jgi:hypothetical protein
MPGTISRVVATTDRAMTFKWNWNFLFIPGALVAVATLWLALGLPRVAWSTDIKQLSVEQTNIVIDFATEKIQRAIANTPAPTASPQQQEAWKEELEHAKVQRTQAEQRKLELSK